MDLAIEKAKKYGVDKIFLPGEIETDKYNKALKEGVFLGDGVEGNLLRLKEEYNV